MTKQCGTCGSEFTPNRRVGARQKYCNEKCAKKAEPSYNRGRRNPWTERPCSNCGTVFQRSGPRGGACRYCSPTCKSEAASKRFYDQRWKHVARRYGLTAADFETMFAEQGGACAICSRELTGRALEPGTPQVDHDHETGRVRGILCRPCNTALGMFQDDPELVVRAAQYLRAAK